MSKTNAQAERARTRGRPRILRSEHGMAGNRSDRYDAPVVVELPPKRYKIGELVAFTGLTRQTLHNYTRWGLIREVAWTDGGHRLYDERAFQRLARIMAMRPGLTVGEIRRQLGEVHSSSDRDG